jgi:hypothetical protein
MVPLCIDPTNDSCSTDRPYSHRAHNVFQTLAGYGLTSCKARESPSRLQTDRSLKFMLKSIRSRINPFADWPRLLDCNDMAGSGHRLGECCQHGSQDSRIRCCALDQGLLSSWDDQAHPTFLIFLDLDDFFLSRPCNDDLSIFLPVSRRSADLDTLIPKSPALCFQRTDLFFDVPITLGMAVYHQGQGTGVD